MNARITLTIALILLSAVPVFGIGHDSTSTVLVSTIQEYRDPLGGLSPSAALDATSFAPKHGGTKAAPDLFTALAIAGACLMVGAIRLRLKIPLYCETNPILRNCDTYQTPRRVPSCTAAFWS